MRQFRPFAILALFALAAAPLFARSSQGDGHFSVQAGPGCPMPGCIAPVMPQLAAMQIGPGCPMPGCIAPVMPQLATMQEGPGCPMPGLCALPLRDNPVRMAPVTGDGRFIFLAVPHRV